MHRRGAAMHSHQRLLLLLLPVVHRLLPAHRAMRHGLAELGQRVVGLRPLGQAATAVDEVAEHDQSPVRSRARKACDARRDTRRRTCTRPHQAVV
eukprot:scaffold21013_cov63-Phaeocystis_antarctica.AAC.1